MVLEQRLPACRKPMRGEQRILRDTARYDVNACTFMYQTLLLSVLYLHKCSTLSTLKGAERAQKGPERPREAQTRDRETHERQETPSPVFNSRNPGQSLSCSSMARWAIARLESVSVCGRDAPALSPGMEGWS